MNDHMFVVTGGPGSSKSSLVEALIWQGYCSMPEAGRAIIQHQVRIGGSTLPWALGGPGSLHRTRVAVLSRGCGDDGYRHHGLCSSGRKRKAAPYDRPGLITADLRGCDAGQTRL